MQGATAPDFAAAPGAPPTGSRAVVLLDAETGTVLYEKNAGEEIPPASLTKLVTIHLALEAIAEGTLDPGEPFAPPEQSWTVNQPPRSSLMFLGPGQRVTVGELLLGLAVSSGNDAAAALALRISPDIETFARRMTGEFRALGLGKTRFVEPSGISEYNSTTAREFAAFCREYIRLHPETLAELHSVPSFAYPKAENVAPRYRENPGAIAQNNRNPLLGRVAGVDGLKTGYIDEAGYNIALTAERDGTRLLAVILGAPAVPGLGERIRNQDGSSLLEWGFGNFRTLRPALEEPAPARLWKGRERAVPVTWGEALPFTAPKNRGRAIFVAFEYADPLIAPLPEGSPAGFAVISDTAGELRRLPLVTAADAPSGSLFRRILDSIRLFFRNR